MGGGLLLGLFATSLLSLAALFAPPRGVILADFVICFMGLASARLGFRLIRERYLAPFKRIIKEYFEVCESYYAAIKRSALSQIEAIDMGRRGLHNEGSEILRERLAGKVEIDFGTARRLFTLICALHMKT